MKTINEYAKVTRSGDGTLDCIGQFTQRLYKDVEFLEDTNIDSPPKVNDIGVLMELHNDEFVWLGRLKQYQGDMEVDEFRLMPGKPFGIVIKEDQLEIYKATVTESGSKTEKSFSYVNTMKLKFENNGNITLETTGDINIKGNTVNLNP
jgi:hypothetical protein